jgi:hypothetical protein
VEGGASSLAAIGARHESLARKPAAATKICTKQVDGRGCQAVGNRTGPPQSPGPFLAPLAPKSADGDDSVLWLAGAKLAPGAEAPHRRQLIGVNPVLSFCTFPF